MVGDTCKFSGFQSGAPEYSFPGILALHYREFTAGLDSLEERKIFTDCPGFLGCHAFMPCHWSLVTQLLKIKALCSLEMSGNTAATHSHIPEHLDQEPQFLGHPPYSRVHAN
jgi:hypothetical protein